jgi:hypothetical protein
MPKGDDDVKREAFAGADPGSQSVTHEGSAKNGIDHQDAGKDVESLRQARFLSEHKRAAGRNACVL